MGLWCCIIYDNPLENTIAGPCKRECRNSRNYHWSLSSLLYIWGWADSAWDTSVSTGPPGADPGVAVWGLGNCSSIKRGAFGLLHRSFSPRGKGGGAPTPSLGIDCETDPESGGGD